MHLIVVLALLAVLFFDQILALSRMSKYMKVKKIKRVLDGLFPPPIPIPLDHGSNFQFLIAVILSAQTTDFQVNKVTKSLFKIAGDAQSMSKLDQKEIENSIRSLGLYANKSKNISLLSKKVMGEFDGSLPETKEGLMSLPGVGDKTASVYMSQILGVPSFAVDTHIHRLALRFGLTKNDKDANKVARELEQLFPQEIWSETHLQFIYFGREYCTAKNHVKSECPICHFIDKPMPAEGDKDKEASLDRLIDDKVAAVLAANDQQVLEAAPGSPKKGIPKNILLYSDRKRELEKSPELCLNHHSPTRPIVKAEASIIDDIKREKEGTGRKRKAKASINEEIKLENADKPKRGRPLREKKA